jgi:hypothetical protein
VRRRCPGGVSGRRRGDFRADIQCHAIDPEWKLFTAKAIARASATVVPIFFEGQNSRLFQLASHVSLTLRLSLLFSEVRNKIGSVVAVRIGVPIAYAELSHLGDRKALADHLRRMTYQLGGGSDGAPSCSVRLRFGDRRYLLRTTCRRLAELMRDGASRMATLATIKRVGRRRGA